MHDEAIQKLLEINEALRSKGEAISYHEVKAAQSISQAIDDLKHVEVPVATEAAQPQPTE